MSIATVVTRGFGSFGSISDVVTRGYSIGVAVISNTPLVRTIFVPERDNIIYAERDKTIYVPEDDDTLFV